ncbi:MAG TPA: PHP domain-containing protein [Bacillota bacterium]|nr:PHP domain-containing protein [Bacillota bacterium]HPE38271.1 PHP domain-containing protein [Bacillota bacterium]
MNQDSIDINCTANHIRNISLPSGTTFALELHMHTSDASACGTAHGEEMAAAYKAAGYHGIIVTDHFLNGNCAISRELPWEEQIDGFCRGYERAKAWGDTHDLRVFFGFEYNYDTTEFITLGLDDKWLKAHPEIMTIPLEDYLRLVRCEGGYLIHVHPFRKEAYIRAQRLFPELEDAVEVINLGNSDPEWDELAYQYAKEHHLTMTSGSDCHVAGRYFGAGIAINKVPNTIEDVIRILRRGTGYELLGADGERKPMHRR